MDALKIRSCNVRHTARTLDTPTIVILSLYVIIISPRTRDRLVERLCCGMGIKDDTRIVATRELSSTLPFY